MDDAQLYTLRVWRGAGRWRAVLRAVGDEKTTSFTAPEPLAAWLRAGGSDAPVPAPPVQGPGDGAVEGQVEQREQQ
jgi:hypothetical protein